MEHNLAPATLCIHAGHEVGADQPALVPPVVRSTTFLLDDEAYARRAAGRADEARIYARETSPTVEAVEGKLAALEGAERALLFASGMAAMHALLLASLRAGDHVVSGLQLYGGSRGLLTELLPRFGVEETVVDIEDPGATAAAFRPETKLLLIESISNPTIAVADLPALAELAHARGARVAVDATFATPMAQRPLLLGADVVHHSATKYLGGHSDVTAGVLAFRGVPDLGHAAWQWRTKAGGCADPEAASLLDRGLRTLHLRMRAHSDNAAAVARFLASREDVTRVFHPSLETHASYAIGQRVLELPSGMLSFVLRGGDEAALRFARALRLVFEAASLGGVESLVSLPCNMSHVGLTVEERLAAGIPPGMVRLSIGVEDPADLIADVQQALDAAAAG
ncbi:MAG: aminotransferase class I/II-fold pyridoxal phosphate-dependent enzyme [Planctomycetota bacterium]